MAAGLIGWSGGVHFGLLNIVAGRVGSAVRGVGGCVGMSFLGEDGSASRKRVGARCACASEAATRPSSCALSGEAADACTLPRASYASSSAGASCPALAHTPKSSASSAADAPRLETRSQMPSSKPVCTWPEKAMLPASRMS
eukprot:320295-Pleurochrysis_carterae.AAC.2